MSGINTGKVITGGVVAGIVFNAIDMVVNGFLMKADYAANAARLNLDAAAMETTGAMVTWITIDFILGLLVVFTYAAFRPRFGPGPKTAIFAGLTILMGIEAVMYGFTVVGMFSMTIFAKNSLFSLVNIIVGSIAGAAVYKET